MYLLYTFFYLDLTRGKKSYCMVNYLLCEIVSETTLATVPSVFIESDIFFILRKKGGREKGRHSEKRARDQREDA